MTQAEAIMELQNIMQTEPNSFDQAVKLKRALLTIEERIDLSDIKVPGSVLQQVRYHVGRHLEVNQ